MEFEALFLGIEPLTALAVGLGAAVLVPVMNAVGQAVGQEDLGAPLAETARESTKKVIVWSLEVFDNAQVAFAEAEESFRDLVADAKAEHATKQNTSEPVTPREVEIVSE